MTKILFTNVILLRTAFLLLIVVVEGSPAQTTVCNGDSVVLVFNGYKQGSSVWKQSPDRTNWFNAQELLPMILSSLSLPILCITVQ